MLSLQIYTNTSHIEDLEKHIKKVMIVSFMTKEKMLHYDDRLGINMLFSEPTQMLGMQDSMYQVITR